MEWLLFFDPTEDGIYSKVGYDFKGPNKKFRRMCITFFIFFTPGGLNINIFFKMKIRMNFLIHKKESAKKYIFVLKLLFLTPEK